MNPRLRGHLTEEELLEQQRLFLERNETPSARALRREGGGGDARTIGVDAKAVTDADKSRRRPSGEEEKEEEEEEKKMTTSAEERKKQTAFGLGGNLGSNNNEDAVNTPFVVEEASLKIIERDTSNVIPTAPRAKEDGSETRGFPKAEHRSKETTTTGSGDGEPKIMSKFARRRAEMRGEKILDVHEPRTKTGRANASSAAAASATAIPEHEDKDVAAETKRVLETMSSEEAMKQKKELEEKMDPKLVAFFRNRNNRNKMDATTTSADKKEGSPPSTATAAGNSKTNTSKKPDAMKLMKANVDPMSRVHAADVRFTASGEPIVPVEHYQNISAQEGRIPAPTERDFVRAGGLFNKPNIAASTSTEESDDPGYTLLEARQLCVSSVPGQRALGYRLLANVFKSARRFGHAPERVATEEPKELPLGSTWAGIWVSAVVDVGAVSLVRRGLDDSNPLVFSSAAMAMRELCCGRGGGGVFGTEERLMSQLESFAGVPAISKAYSAVTCHAPMWRESRDDAPKGGRGYEPKAWEPAGGVIEIDQSTNLVVCDEEDEEIANRVMQAATTGAKLDPEAEAELRRIESERAVDPIAAFLRAKTLERVRYLLEMERSPVAEIPLLQFLSTAATHSTSAAVAVAKCPRLMDVLCGRVTSFASSSSPLAPPEGVNPIAARAYVLETICAIVRVGGVGIVFEGHDVSNDRVNIAHSAVQLVSSIKPMEDFEPASANCWRQAMRLWSLCANRGIPTCPNADDYFSLLANCVDVDPSNVSNEGYETVREAFNAFSSFCSNRKNVKASTPLLKKISGFASDWILKNYESFSIAGARSRFAFASAAFYLDSANLAGIDDGEENMDDENSSTRRRLANALSKACDILLRELAADYARGIIASSEFYKARASRGAAMHGVLCVLKALAGSASEKNEEENEEMRESKVDEYIRSIAQSKALEAIDTLCAAMYRETVGVERARRADVKMRQQRARQRGLSLDVRSGDARTARGQISPKSGTSPSRPKKQPFAGSSGSPNDDIGLLSSSPPLGGGGGLIRTNEAFTKKRMSFDATSNQISAAFQQKARIGKTEEVAASIVAEDKNLPNRSQTKSPSPALGAVREGFATDQSSSAQKRVGGADFDRSSDRNDELEKLYFENYSGEESAQEAHAHEVTTFMGLRAFWASAALPTQRALVQALEILEQFGLPEIVEDEFAPPMDEEEKRCRKKQQRAEYAKTCLYATATLLRSLPPGAGSLAKLALKNGIMSARSLDAVLDATRTALIDAESDFVNTANNATPLNMTNVVSAAQECGVILSLAAQSLVPPVDSCRDALLGGYTIEFTTASEARKYGCDPMKSVLPTFSDWFFAPVSPSSAVRGWDVASIASILSLVLGYEKLHASTIVELNSSKKLSAMSNVFLKEMAIWRDPAVTAPLAALTDLYWSQTVFEFLQNDAMQSTSSPLGYTKRMKPNEKSLSDPLNIAEGSGDASVSSALAIAFGTTSYADALFGRHVSFWLRSDVPAKARASCWIALRENLSLHLLPSIAKLVEPIHSHIILPRGGEQDPEMFELYISTLESGDLDKWFASWEKFEGWDYGSNGSKGARLPFEAPPVAVALVVHAVAHVVIGGAGGNALQKKTIRRLLSKDRTGTYLRAIMNTPLMLRRRPRFASTSAKTNAGELHETPFGWGFCFGKFGKWEDMGPRRSVLLDACSEDEELLRLLRHALVACKLATRESMDVHASEMSMEKASSFYA
jgi:hypothetical protein